MSHFKSAEQKEEVLAVIKEILFSGSAMIYVQLAAPWLRLQHVQMEDLPNPLPLIVSYPLSTLPVR